MAGGKQFVIISNTKDDQKRALKKGITDFNNKITTTQKTIDSLNKILDSLQIVMDTSQNDSLKQKIEIIKNQIKNDSSLIIALKKGINDINNELKDLDNDTINTQKRKNNSIDKLNKTKSAFEAHWGGIEFGLNSFILDRKYLINNTSNILAPNLGNSYNVNINLFESEFGITKFMGIVTGIGIQFHNFDYSDFPYYSENEYLIYTDSLHSSYDNLGKIRHIKLKYVNFTIPLITEIQFNNTGDIYINLGGYIALRTFAKLKFIYSVDDKRTVLKYNIDKMLNPFEYGVSVRFGIKKIQLYSQYSLVPLLKNQANPYINPITVGLRLNL